MGSNFIWAENGSKTSNVGCRLILNTTSAPHNSIRSDPRLWVNQPFLLQARYPPADITAEGDVDRVPISTMQKPGSIDEQNAKVLACLID
ncbi:hypothetical protein WAI453_011024 [Rhynchosporium graminicola]